MKVVVDLEKCQGYANCIVEAPEVFDIDPATGKAMLLVEDPPEDEYEAVMSAVRNCPTTAISTE